MAELIHEYRGSVLENIHNGRICIVDDEKNVRYSVGDIETLTYYRSCSKPVQALPVFVRELPEKYGLTTREMAIMAASHAGEDMHLETILSMLKKAGFSEDDFVMNPTYPMDKSTYEKYIRQGLPPRKAVHNCTGKHVATMLLQKDLTGSNRDYWKPDSPAQQEIANYISAFSEYSLDGVEWGTDGCGVPVFAAPLRCMAVSCMKLACPDVVEDPAHRRAVETLTSCMHENPLMIMGTGFLCSILNDDPNIIAKAGARGAYIIGLKKERLGIAIKVGDGTEAYWPMIIAEILRQISYDDKAGTVNKVEERFPSIVLNDNKLNVGVMRPVFKLNHA